MGNSKEIIMESTVMDVSADNYDEFDHELVPEKLGKKLVQENRLKRTMREYQIYGPTHLLLNFIEKKKKAPINYRVNLTYLTSKPEHLTVTVMEWLYGAIAAGVMTILLIVFAIYGFITIGNSFIAGSVTLSITLICVFIFVYLKRDEYIFRGAFGGLPLFFLENSKPDQLTFDSFLVDFQQIIGKQHSKMSVMDRLVGELKMCRRLKDEGIIDDDAYTSARTAIFKHKEYKA